MDAQKIWDLLKPLKADRNGTIRGKNKVVDSIQSEHWKAVDNELTSIRIFVARISTGHTTAEALKMIDEFIYKRGVQ